MLHNDEARVPFAVIGVLLVIVSTIVTVYLASMGSANVARGIEDDRDRDINRALTLAASDIGTALNYAGLTAEAMVGKSPVVNAGNYSPIGKGAVSADDERIKYYAWQELSKYLEANYNGSFTYGDFKVVAQPDGDYRSMGIIPDNMTAGRKFDHPLIACRKNYTAYYTMTVPVRLTISRPGSDFSYSEDRVIRSLITARYPLLRDLTEEFAVRLNGTPMSLDLTAAACALTWARGYTQYGAGTPLNIVDNSQVELVVNGALLTEEGFEYNSVDPLGLATLTYKCLGNAARPSEVNGYNVTNNSEAGLPQNGTEAPPEKYTFNVDDMVDRAYDNVSFGGYTECTLDGAYTMQMYVEISREPDCYPRVNSTFVKEERSEMQDPAGTGILLTRAFRVCRDNSDGKGFADRVTVTYHVARYSVLQYFGAGKYTDSSARLGDPVLDGSSGDVAGPFGTYTYEKDLDFGHKSFTDDNLREAVRRYEASFDRSGDTGRFERVLAEILGDRDAWQERVPAAFTDPSYEFVCGPDNRHPVWAEIEADYELRDLSNAIKKEITIDLDPRTCDGSPADMTQVAYSKLSDMFRSRYGGYLDRQSYFSSPSTYRSCGSKAIFRIREAFLIDLSRQLEAASNVSSTIDKAIDGRMSGTGLTTSDLKAGTAGAKNYLKERIYIPFGLPMSLNSSIEFACGYPWEENITLAVEQSPSYLDTGRYTDEETGYAVRTLRLRNVCLFSPLAELPSIEGAAEAMAGPVLAAVDAAAGSVENMANRTLTREVDALTNDISSMARETLKQEITIVLGENTGQDTPGLHTSASEAVDRAFARRGNDGKAIIRDLCNGTLAKEIAGDIVSASASDIRKKAGEIAAGYVDDYTLYVERKVREKVADAGHKAIVQVTDRLKSEIRDTLRDFTSAATDELLKKGADAALQKALGAIPSGLPLVPPWGWWATLNVWYIEVQGEIPVFTVYDADAEAIPDPVFGGRAIAYTRRYEVIRDDRGLIIGKNEPVRFQARTGTFILVPPGGRGVGDKAGGWDEKSQGYDEKESA